MYNKTFIHEDVYEIHNDVSSLYHDNHQHSSRTVLKQINHSKQVRFNSSPPEVFEYEALDPENFLYDNNYHEINFNVKGQGISGNDSYDFFEIEDRSGVYENETSTNGKNVLTLPIPNRRELFELENYPSDLNQNNLQTLGSLRVEDILSIDGKFIQKTTLSDTNYDTNSSNADPGFSEHVDKWINLKDIKLEIDKISINKEPSNSFNDIIVSKNHPTNNDQLNNPDFVDLQSTTESLSFL
ncbi:hypothetical protein [Cryptosporidium parvum Iowa II]|uniref:Uncharacterized protein n=2 Tax=Cryptosporidium parvum TaxID=5807 RepID=Q5CPP1_CRYPI|nr:hypothetical protein [Cryptosporidium parvum Iowa II]EAK87387.1 hypothetical protein cgd2_100 [Cryptosporidium parvum Iowa II]QOY43198.1 Uncharacterized protein CPATCC_0030490 [Cryptosporidium parvum]WKS76331.1 hypothetical protein CPCDC_2g100 [Cryptosporidium sp. 43IA8]WRK30823.1 Uncharacterized protein cpbgf_200100 [Cryptosporidium parvum]|eukprot:QOY43198.1 hypothetical protein CPATCC_000922 [Cryptosporidium parvum]